MRRVPIPVVALTLVLAGCGGDVPGEGATTAPPATTGQVEPQIGGSHYFQPEGIEYVYGYLGYDAQASYDEATITGGAERCVALAFELDAQYSSSMPDTVICWLFTSYDDMVAALPGFAEGAPVPQSPSGDCWLARAEGTVDAITNLTRGPGSC